MKRTTIILAALILLLGVSPASSVAEAQDQDGAAVLANDAGLSLEGLRRDMGLVYDTPRASVAGQSQEEDGNEGLFACHFTGGCGYTVNPQVMVDLQYRLTEREETPYTFANKNGPGEVFAPNLMLGVRYTF